MKVYTLRIKGKTQLKKCSLRSLLYREGGRGIEPQDFQRKALAQKGSKGKKLKAEL